MLFQLLSQENPTEIEENISFCSLLKKEEKWLDLNSFSAVSLFNRWRAYHQFPQVGWQDNFFADKITLLQPGVFVFQAQESCKKIILDNLATDSQTELFCGDNWQKTEENEIKTTKTKTKPINETKPTKTEISQISVETEFLTSVLSIPNSILSCKLLWQDKNWQKWQLMDGNHKKTQHIFLCLQDGSALEIQKIRKSNGETVNFSGWQIGEKARQTK